ncbi:MAG: GatB/YqeY domain-containing protein [Patescibacteria group bacterium]
MSRHAEIKDELKTALKAKDAVRLRTIRSILTACTNELVAKGQTPQEELTDEAVLAVIKRLAKQRKESITQYEAANRPELAAPEAEELAILEQYLPQQLSQAELRPIVVAKRAELSISDQSQTGRLIGAVLQEVKGQADGADVKAVVEAVLSETK